MANWYIGQIKTEETDETALLQHAKEMGTNEEEFRKALEDITTMPQEQFEKIAETLYLLANQLSEQAYQILQLKHHQDSMESLVKEKTESLGTANEKLKDTNKKLVNITKKQS